MKALATALNVFGFTALFIVYTSGGAIDRPSGVRRALETYAGQSQTGPYEPGWKGNRADLRQARRGPR